MFALGGNSTQTSLASILTTSIKSIDSADKAETIEQEPEAATFNQVQADNSSSLVRGYGTFDVHASQPSQNPKLETTSRSEQNTAGPTTSQRLRPSTVSQRLYQFIRNHMPRRQKSLQGSHLVRIAPNMRDSSTMSDSSTMRDSSTMTDSSSMTDYPRRRSSQSENVRMPLSSPTALNTGLTASISHKDPADQEINRLRDDIRLMKERLQAKRREATLRSNARNARKSFSSNDSYSYQGAGIVAPQFEESVAPKVPQHQLEQNFIEAQSIRSSSDTSIRHHLRSLDLSHSIADRHVAQTETDQEVAEQDSLKTPVSDANTESIPLLHKSSTNLLPLKVEDKTVSDLSSSHRTPRGDSSSGTPQRQSPELEQHTVKSHPNTNDEDSMLPFRGYEGAAQLLAKKDYGNVDELNDMLQENFSLIAKDEYSWLHELDEIGYTREEMAELLLEDKNDSPWIYFKQKEISETQITPVFHLPACVHQGGQSLSRSPGLIAAVPEDHTPALSWPAEEDDMKRVVAELCGFAGIVPNS